MRKLIVGTAAALALAVSAPAQAATTNVAIKKGGFSPAGVTITTGDTVTWLNTDITKHQVVSDAGKFASPILQPGQSWSYTFALPNLTADLTYHYHDGFTPKLKGTVTVKPIPFSATIALSAPIVFFGDTITISGTISNGRAGEQVVVFQKAYPQTSYEQRAIVLTTAAGHWDLAVQPSLLTYYQAQWRGVSSPEVYVQVKPRVSLVLAPPAKPYAAARTVTMRVDGVHAFNGRVVYLQRLSAVGQWVTLKRVELGTNSSSRFTFLFPRGHSSLRVFMTVNQAGAGYLDTVSKTVAINVH
jgi:plastocyanin